MVRAPRDLNRSKTIYPFRRRTPRAPDVETVTELVTVTTGGGGIQLSFKPGSGFLRGADEAFPDHVPFRVFVTALNEKINVRNVVVQGFLRMQKMLDIFTFSADSTTIF